MTKTTLTRRRRATGAWWRTALPAALARELDARGIVCVDTTNTEVADWLSRRGIPFAQAHEITGALVRRCEDRGIGLSEVTDEDLAAVDPRLTADIRDCLTPEAAVAARTGHGGTAPAEVTRQIQRLREKLAGQRQWAAEYAGPRG